MNFERQTQIISTLGPASSDEKTILQLIRAGVDVFRFSYGRDSLRENNQRLRVLQKYITERSTSFLTLQDLPGKKNRIVSKQTKWVKPGEQDELIWTSNYKKETNSGIFLLFPIPQEELNLGDIIFFGDGDFSAHFVSHRGKQKILVEFDSHGEVAFGRGVTVLQKSAKQSSALTTRDKYFIEKHFAWSFDFIALSFVNTGNDIVELRHFLNRFSTLPGRIISKIETKQALENIDDILDVSDGIMIARGDLGINIPFEQLPLIQNQLIKKAISKNKYVIVATQMLESISEKCIPHRAEITDISTAVYQGASALMLSGETRTGKRPVDAVKAMDKIIRQAEMDLLDETSMQGKCNFQQRE